MSVDVHKVDGLRILSLDGGDLNCISQLKILEEFMKRLENDSDAGKAMRPCEYFHSITGVGASGVIAILLGVLGLSVDDASAAFIRFCEEASLGQDLDPHLRSAKLVAATKVLLQGISVPEESKLQEDLHRGEGCKVSIPYMAAADMTHCRILRSYKSGHSSHNPTIIEAIRIAWANPGLFPPLPIGPKHMQEELVSAVDGYNNPTLQAVEEAHNAFGRDQKVACLLSLGTGKPGNRSVTMESAQLAQMIARDTESTAEQLDRRYAGLQIYFRLSVDRTLELGTASGTIEQKVGRITSYTSTYLETHAISETLGRCVRISQSARHITMESLYRTRASGSRSSLGLPPLSAFFVPREKPMGDIVEALRTRMPGSPAIGLVIGLSGTGKTQISLKYAYDHDDEYDYIIFVDASSTESLEKSLVTRIKLIDRQLGPTNAEEALGLLASPEGRLTRNWLVIMDNADNSNVKLQDYIPSCDHGCILITSRNAALSDLSPQGHVELGAMTSEEAVEALLSAALGPKIVVRPRGHRETRTGRLQSACNPRTKQDEECAGRIVEELGCLPLAVIQAACYIRKQKCLHEYPTLLKTSRHKILRWPASVQRDTLKYAHSTYAAFDTTLSALSPRALKFLGIISFVNFSDFPKALIELAASLDFNYQPHDLLDRPPEYQSAIDLLRELFCPEGKWDSMELDGLLEELQSYSLVSLVTVSTIITLRFHPLLHGWANDRLSTSDRVMFRSAAVRVLACGTNVDDDYLWPYLSSHIERFSLTTDELHVNDKAAFMEILWSNGHYNRAADVWENIHAVVERVHGERHLRTSRAALELADIYSRNGDWQRAESMERKIVEMRRGTLGDNHLETIDAMARLGHTCSSYGERYDEAVQIKLEVLRVRRELCGPKHRKIMEALTDLADAYEGQGRYHEARALLVEALDMISSLVGRTHPATINVMEQLAHCYTASGDGEESIRLGQEVVELRRTVRGDTHIGTLTAMAELYYKQGQSETAEKIWRDLVNRWREAVGGHREHISQSLGGLAHSVYDLCQYSEAEALWKEVLARRRTTLGDMHLDTLSAQYWLARSIYYQRRYPDAEELFRNLVVSDRTTYGDQHVTTLDAIAFLAYSVDSQSRYAEAEVLWKEVALGRRIKLGDKHPDTFEALDSLTWCICKQRRFTEAETLWRENMENLRITLGDEHEETLEALDHLADCISSQERYAEAEAMWRHLLSVRRKKFGDRDMGTVDVLESLAQCIYDQEDYAGAEVLYREVVAAKRIACGERHEYTLATLHWLARSVYDQERYEEAEILWREVLVGSREELGENHEDTLCSLFWLALAVKDQKRYAEAEALWRELLAGDRITFGEQHDNTLNALYRLGKSVSNQARYAEAETLYREALAGRRALLGDQHRDTLEVLHSLGLCLYDQERYAECEVVWRGQLPLDRSTLGDQHSDTLETIHWLGRSVHAQERYAEAETLWKEAVAALRNTLGPEDEDTVEAQTWLDEVQSAMAADGSSNSCAA